MKMKAYFHIYPNKCIGNKSHKQKRHKKTGNLLYSQGQAQLFSPLKCLTSVFGMGTGVSTSLSSPDLLFGENSSLKTE